jgi:tRNA(Ile)-lysidine synthase
MSRRDSRSDAAGGFIQRVEQSLDALGACGQHIVVAISGGPDSVALLRALHVLRIKVKLELSAAHANHALRGEESEADERFVRELCERLDVPLVCRRLPVPLPASERSEGIEATARELRQRFFADAALELGACFVATAHTADDQAETVLHRIIRGTGLAGLAGIQPSRQLAPGVKLIRPLLGLRRAGVIEYLAAVGQDFREDRSNRELTFTRNRLRHELIPYLAEHFNPQVAEALTRLAGLAADAQAAIDLQVDRLLRRALIRRNRQAVVLSATVLRRSPRFLVCGLLRRLWAEQSWPLQGMGQAELDRVASLVDANGSACDLPGGVRASRQRDRVVLSYAENAPASGLHP